MQTVNSAVAPAQSALALTTIGGKSLVEAQASLEEIFEHSANAEKQINRGEGERDRADALLLDWVTMSEIVDGKSVKVRGPKLDMSGNPVNDKDGKPIIVFKPISYPEYLQVRSWGIAKYFDAGAPTPEAAELQMDRQFNRLVALGWERPRSKNPDAERMAKKRAEQVAKFADKSDGELIEAKADLLAKGDSKSIAQAQAIAKEIDRREKPQLDAEEMARKSVRDKIIARAKELCKAGTADADEKLISALQALA
jgi:hypothetical protein